MALDTLTSRISGSYINSDTNLPLMFRSTVLKNVANHVGTAGLNYYGYNLYNPNTVDVFLKMYNTLAAPTVGADTVTETIQVAAGCSVVLRGSDIMYRFTSGLWVAFTTGVSDVDNTAPTTGCLTQIFYKE